MAEKLKIFNGALRLLGERPLSALTEEGASRRALDGAWDDAVAFVLEAGHWNFATRTVEIAADEDIEPAFGYSYAFEKPSDFVRLTQLSADEMFSFPLMRYEDEAGYWHGDVDKVYVRYVSNDDAYGMNLGAWPVSFVKALEAYLAFECGLPINQNKGDRNDLFSLYEKRLKEAKSRDAMNERPRFLPPGSWTRSRTSNRGRTRNDYGRA